MKFKPLEKFDFIIVICVLILTVMGVAYIYSSGIDSSGYIQNTNHIKQIIWASVGFVMMLVVSLLNYKRTIRYIKFIVPAILVLLVITPFFGATLNNARSWLKIGKVFIQPSEFSKIIYILFFAWYLEKSKKDKPQKRFALSLVFLAIPLGLILLQPDFGTAMVFIPIFLFMCLIAGIPIRYVAGLFFSGALIILFTVLPLWETYIYGKSVPIIKLLTNKKLFMVLIATSAVITLMGLLGFIFLKKSYFYWITYVSGIIFLGLVGSLVFGKVLKEYQIKRLIIFLNPNVDPKDAGWNIINSQIAIGSGGFSGKGYLMGTQSHYRFLPQQSTDFIFGILAEESGFLGCMVLFVAYLAILLRIIKTMRTINDSYGLNICAGVLGLFFFHFLINVGMVMGIMPCTGIPLPFVSYGGSAYITNAAALGLVMSARSRKLDFSLSYLGKS
ncbi:MAG: rod shape-determining protein RodA [Treponema sp.]|nr:rod shape-determining protein RodA [Treponema sp.]